MHTYLDCVPCFVRQALDAARLASNDDNIHQQVVRQTLLLVADMDMTQSPPFMAQKIHRLIRTLVGSSDPYKSQKNKFNIQAMELVEHLQPKIKSSKDKIETAIRLAIAGNIIDLGVKSNVSQDEVEEIINNCLDYEFDNGSVADFKEQVNKAEKILYLTDNAGEIVFDKLLIEQLDRDKITAAVKGSPIINDATIEDAELIGLTNLVKVIDNGSDAPGTILNLCSSEFNKAFQEADLIISKGQGNYETLSNVDKNIYFILKVKCPVIAKDLSACVGKMILQRSKFFRR